MRGIQTIAAREWADLIRTPTGWWLLAGLHLVSGLFFLILVERYVVGAAEGAAGLTTGPVRVHDHLVAPWLGNTALVLLLLGPAIAMRSLADEVRLHTLPLLLSAPLSAGQIVVGKFLGAWLWSLFALATTLWIPGWLSLHASIDVGALAAGYLALSLVAANVVAIGVACSSFTAQPAVALVLAASITLVLWVLGLTDPDPTSFTSRVALSTHVRDMLLGLVRLSDLTYLLVLPLWCLLAAHERVEAWRRP